MLRRLGSARVVGLALALVWLVAAATTATQRYSPPSLQGRVNAAFMMLILTPQTVSIAAGTLLISLVDYRLLLLISLVDYRLLLLLVILATGACGLLLLIRPAAEPADVDEPGDGGPGDQESSDREPGGRGLAAATGQAEPNPAAARA